ARRPAVVARLLPRSRTGPPPGPASAARPLAAWSRRRSGSRRRESGRSRAIGLLRLVLTIQPIVPDERRDGRWDQAVQRGAARGATPDLARGHADRRQVEPVDAAGEAREPRHDLVD